MTKHTKIIAVSVLILIAALSRLLPHPLNFSPVGAMAIFGGVYYHKKWLAFAAPLVALFISDMLLPYGLYSGIMWVYGAFLFSVLVGFSIKSNANPVSVLLGCLFGSAAFFIITNFGVWYAGGLYPPTAQGLSACYVAAIPFFKNSLLGDICYTAILFGGYELLKNRVPALDK
jgi:hypothetical protein